MVDSRYPFGTLSISLKSDYLVFTRGTAFCASMNILRFKHARAIFFGNCGSLGNRRNTPVSVLQNAVFDAPEILFRVSRRWKIDVRSHISVRAIKDLASNNSILKLLRCLQSSLFNHGISNGVTILTHFKSSCTPFLKYFPLHGVRTKPWMPINGSALKSRKSPNPIWRHRLICHRKAERRVCSTFSQPLV